VTVKTEQQQLEITHTEINIPHIKGDNYSTEPGMDVSNACLYMNRLFDKNYFKDLEIKHSMDEEMCHLLQSK
jgi:hypothetical protein